MDSLSARHKRLIKISLLICFIILSGVIYIKTSKVLIPKHQRKEINQKIIIPPEIFKGDTIYIGDDFERIAHFVRMGKFWTSNTIFGGSDTIPGYYYATNRGVGHLTFNYTNKLIQTDFTTNNTDSLSSKDFLSQVGKIMIKYYGNNFKIYNYDDIKETRVLIWDLPDSNNVLVYGYVKGVNLQGEDSNTIKIEYNDRLNPKYYKLNTTETAKDLGLE